ncbi:MAG: RluA family pseudouridine synthase [Proteobacteria bacterium]|nr:RluA family pseudouridine synthase [Pseudomonadota bacterium]
MNESDIIFIDNHLLAINKSAGRLVQKDATGDPSLLEDAKHHLKEIFGKPGNVYLGLIHRIDRPVSGLILFARTSKAASRLSEQFRSGTPHKIYLAIAEGELPDKGRWLDYISRDGVTSRLAQKGEGKEARLSFRRLKYNNGLSLVEIELETGRHHQIRLQFSSRGYPLLGDFRYGSKIKFGDRAVALHAHSLTLTHPTLNEKIKFTSEPESFWSDYLS